MKELLVYNPLLDPRTQFLDWLVNRLKNQDSKLLELCDSTDEFKLLVFKGMYLSGLSINMQKSIEISKETGDEKLKIFQEILAQTQDDIKIIDERGSQIYVTSKNKKLGQ